MKGMKQGFGIIALLVGLGLGATVLHDAVPVTDAQRAPNTAQQPVAPLNEKNARLQNEQNTIDIVKRFEPGLVYITTTSETLVQDPFAQFFGGDGTERQVQRGSGSGFFVNAAGDILTNYHVVAGAQKIQLRLIGNEKTYDAKVIGLAPQYDLALIRATGVPKDKIRPIPFADSDRVQVGQKAIAMGAPFGFDFSVTEGIISATDRLIPIGFGQSVNQQGIPQRALQTDAAINPGNSGGPLLDSTGHVMGINTQIISPAGAASGVGQSAGVGFAIPINVARNLLPRLQQANGGEVRAPLLGITAGIVANVRGATAPVALSRVNPELRRQLNLPDSGVVIGTVDPESPAGQAGLKAATRTENVRGGVIRYGGDVILAANDRAVDSIEDLQAVLIDKKQGDRVRLKVWRDGKTREVTITLTAYSFQPPAR